MVCFMAEYNLSLALRQAIAERRAAELCQLIDEHGLVVFARALGPWPERVIADAVTMSPIDRRAAVLRHLPSRVFQRLSHLASSRTCAEGTSLDARSTTGTFR